MADEADMAQPYIDSVIAVGRARAEAGAKRRQLSPIIQIMDGERYGVCHYCTSPIRPGGIFCEADTEEPEHSCSVEWEHEHQRRKASGL